MVIIKEKKTRFGVGKYWKVGTVSVDRRNEVAYFSLALYYENGEDMSLDGFLEETMITNMMEDFNKQQVRDYFINNIYEYPTMYDACYHYAMEHTPYFMDAILESDWESDVPVKEVSEEPKEPSESEGTPMTPLEPAKPPVEKLEPSEPTEVKDIEN